VAETTLKKGTRVTGVDRSKLATFLGKRYDSGESIRSLAASTGRSYGFVHRIHVARAWRRNPQQQSQGIAQAAPGGTGPDPWNSRQPGPRPDSHR
jgi:hypothetical protein